MKDIRSEYESRPFDEQTLTPEPLELLQQWFEAAVANDIALPNAMTLATVDNRGYPATRTVLLKGISKGGLEFFTNYDSAKGQQLALNPNAAITLFWKELNRQINVRGRVDKLTPEESVNYFATRPRGSQISAAISPQSQVISKAELEAKWRALEQQESIVMPKCWGGYRLSPVSVEFWQGRPNRLHDRFIYRLQNENWQVQRLAP